jgi:hypothetical protein
VRYIQSSVINVKSSLGRPRRRWKDIKMGFKERGCEGADYVHPPQEKVQMRKVDIMINLRIR